MIKLELFVLFGLLLGVPLGVLGTLGLQRLRKDRCITVLENGKRCNGQRATVCIDGLCPVHCRVIHRDECRARHLTRVPTPGSTVS